MRFKAFMFPLILFVLFSIPSLIRSQESEIDSLLNLDISDLINLEIFTASKTMQKISHVPATVRVITQEKIKQNGYITLEDALSDLQGFQFRNILGFNSYIFQRGIPNQNNLTLLLVDGVQTNELNSGGFYGGGQFNLDNVERIEVVYGPASALYGTNAVSGIINVITKDPKNSQGLEADIISGMFNSYSAGAGYRYYNDQNEFGLGIAGMYKTSGKADLKGSKGDNNWSESMENFEDDISLDAKLFYNELKMGVTFQNKQASRTTNYKSIGTHYLDHGTSWNINFITSYLKHNLKINDELYLTSMLYYRNTTVLDNTIGYILDTLQARYYRPNNLIGAEEMFSYNISEGISIIGGLVCEWEKLATGFSTTTSASAYVTPPTPKAPEMESNSLLSVYMQSSFILGEFFNLYTGLRFDKSSVYSEILTPRAGLIFNYNKLGAKFLFTSAFRAPKPWDYTSGLGNPELKSEKMQSFEISAHYQLTENSIFEISLYKNLLHDKLSQVNVTSGYYWDNKGNTQIDGIELYSEYANDNLNLYANYTYNYSAIDGTTEVPEIAKHSANFGMRYNFTNKISVGIRNNLYGKRLNLKNIQATNSNYIDAALVTHLNISYERFYGLNFRLFINNLFDTVYFHTSNRPPDRYRQPQRTVLLKLEYNLITN